MLKWKSAAAAAAQRAVEFRDFVVNVESNTSVSEKRITRPPPTVGFRVIAVHFQSRIFPRDTCVSTCAHIVGSNGTLRNNLRRCSIARNSSVSVYYVSLALLLYSKWNISGRNEARGTESTKTNSERN